MVPAALQQAVGVALAVAVPLCLELVPPCLGDAPWAAVAADVPGTSYGEGFWGCQIRVANAGKLATNEWIQRK